MDFRLRELLRLIKELISALLIASSKFYLTYQAVQSGICQIIAQRLLGLGCQCFEIGRCIGVVELPRDLINQGVLVERIQDKSSRG
ncbi:MAG: hypothetical protein ABS35_05275 [Kaistia sp. SCN 65-12]|nr:MAG: hypothetical protein ABS35_05275 [Kaistia sp. SCN 65-12]